MNLTVAIPSYNKEKYIRACIESILQDKKYIDKIILVDNYSSDKTFDIALEYADDITCIQNETNLGMSGNWNKCIDLCTTEWLMIMHADDLLIPGSIKKYEDLEKKHPTVGMLYANAQSMYNDDFTSLTQHTNPKKEFWRAGLEAMECKTSVCSAVMVKKEAYKKLGYFIDESLSSDVEMWHRIASKYNVGFVNDATVIYRINETSTGIDSLIHRPIRKIQKDWDSLEYHMASHYPDKASKNAFIATCKKNAPGAYFAITKANIRAGNIYNVLLSLYIIVVEKHAAIPLLQIIGKIIKKHTIDRITPHTLKD
jgi:glycosyltransferase involved in cell wall biosynthesis